VKQITAQDFTVRVGEIELAGERRRGDGPVVVLLHAGVADRRSWRGVADALAAGGADVVSYDRRGCGETPAPSPDFSHLDDLTHVLDVVTGEPAWLVGSSMGGALALDTALAAPDRVAGLVLVAPAVSGQPEPDLAELDPDSRRIIEAMGAAGEIGDLAELARLEVLLWLDGPSGPEGRVGGAARELALAMSATILAAGLPEDAGQSDIDTWSRIEEIRAPATVTWGDRDVPFGIATSRTVAERLPGLRATEILTGTAHLPYLEQPDAVAAIIARASSPLGA